MKSPITLAILFAAALSAQAPKLTLKVHTGKGQLGYDVNSTMISGEKDMLAQYPNLGMEFTLNDRIATYFPAAAKGN